MLITITQLHAQIIFIFLILFGLIIGSFLNVVTIRLPKAILSPKNIPLASIFSLLMPRSHCNNCQQQISIYDNIPVLSFLFLKGKCRFCQQNISWQYPFIESLFAILTVFLFIHFGFTLQFLSSLLFTACLLSLFIIDLNHYLLPDILTIPLLWIGLLCNSQHLFIPASFAILGAIAGYSTLWIMHILYKKITKKQGLGHGDLKLFAAIGAWQGIYSLPFILLLASVLGSIIGIIWLLINKKDKNTLIPFGPFLAISSFIFFIYGNSILHSYLNLVMVN